MLVGTEVDGLAAVDVVASVFAAESGEFELHAFPNNSATTTAPAIGGSLRITALVYPAQRQIASHG